MTSVHQNIEIIASNFSAIPGRDNVKLTLSAQTPSQQESASPCAYKGSNLPHQPTRAEPASHPREPKRALPPAVIVPTKRPRHKPGERRELLRQAVSDVLTEHISMRRAAQRYNLAKSSLCDFVRKNGILLPNMRSKSGLPGSVSRRVGASDRRLAQTCSAKQAKLLSLQFSQETLSGSATRRQSPSPLSRQACFFGDPACSPVSTLYQKVAPPDLASFNSTRHLLPVVRSIAPHTSASSSLGRIDSPWCNAAGLPTQVPIRSWGLIRTDNAAPMAIVSTGHLTICQNPPAQLQEQDILRSLPFNGETAPDDRSKNEVPVSQQNLYTSQLDTHHRLTSYTAADIDPELNNSLYHFSSNSHSPTASFLDSQSPSLQYSFPPSTPVAISQAEASCPGLFLPPFYSNPNLAASLQSAGPLQGLDESYLSLAADSVNCPSGGLSQSQQVSPPDMSTIPGASFQPSIAAVGAYLVANPQSLLLPFLGHFSSIAALAATAAARSLLQNLTEPSLAPAASSAIQEALLRTPHHSTEGQSGPAQLPDIVCLPKASTLSTQPSDLLLYFLQQYYLQQKLSTSLLQASRDASFGDLDNFPNCQQQVSPLALSTPPWQRLLQSVLTQAKDLIAFIDKSPSPFHVVKSAKDVLLEHGFRELNLKEAWRLAPNDRVFVTKNLSSLFAFTVGGRYRTGNGFSILTAHTDSPCLRLRPISRRCTQGYVQLDVETYGEGLWHTWFDRNLTLAGRCVIRLPNGALEQRLVNLVKPLACVPSLATHLNEETGKTVSRTPEQNLAPILCTLLMEQLVVNAFSSEASIFPTINEENDRTLESYSQPILGNTLGYTGHPPTLLRLLAQELGILEADIVEVELYFADTNPSCLGGIHSEFIHAPRLDNQFNSYASLQSLVSSLNSLESAVNVRVICLLDHAEEVNTANSHFTASLLRRVIGSLSHGTSHNGTESLHASTMANSFLLSASQLLANHPASLETSNISSKPSMHRGLVLRHEPSQQLNSTSRSLAVIRELARRANVPLQSCATPYDQPCARALAPQLAVQLGISLALVGVPQLSLHSCREMISSSSLPQALSLYSHFFQDLPQVYEECAAN